MQAHADPLMELREVKSAVGETTVAVACAGGIKDDGTCMEALMQEQPDIVRLSAACATVTGLNCMRHSIRSIVLRVCRWLLDNWSRHCHVSIFDPFSSIAPLAY